MRPLVLVVLLFSPAILFGQESPGGSGSYILTTDFDYTDFHNFPSKVVTNMPDQPTDWDYRTNFIGHYAPIGCDRKQFPITPKVSPTFDQHFQSPEWWSTHIWNFETSEESRGMFGDEYYISELNLTDLPKNWAAAYGTSTHPHPLVFNNRGYGFGLSQYREGITTQILDKPNWTQFINYDFASDLNISIGGTESYDAPWYKINNPKWVPEETGTQVEEYGDWTAKVSWPYSDGTTLEVTSGHGMPLVQCRRTGDDPVNVGFTGTWSVWYNGQNAIGFSIARFNDAQVKHYAFYFPTGTVVEGADNSPSNDPINDKRFFSYLFDNVAWGFEDVETVNGVPTRIGYDWSSRGLPDHDNDGIGDTTWPFRAFRMILPPGAEHFSIAALPNDDIATLQAFQQRAFAFVTDSRVSYSYNQQEAKMDVQFSLSTELVPDAPIGSLNETVQALYMHQYKHGANANSSETYISPRGPMHSFYGNTFDVTYDHVGLLPNLGWANTADSADLYAQLDEIKKQESLFYDKNPYGWDDANAPPGFFGETYEHGKFLNKYADLLPLCKQVGNNEVFTLLLDSLKANLEDWFDASDALPGGDRYKFFAYDARVSSMAGYPTGHYAAPNLNDHQLHWGYFIKAAAMIARYDQAWAADWGPMVEMLIRDANSWMRDDPLFAYMRYFDPFEGHSWISGRAEGRTGLDIESSSESINFATAVALWGANTNQPEIRDWGLFIATIEYKGVEYYWWDKDDDVHASDYPNRAVATIWGASSNFETFFPVSPMGKYGINWLPITGASMYLGYDTIHMKQLWNEMEVQEFQATDMAWVWDPLTNAGVDPSHRMKGWRSLAAMYRSMWDPTWSIDMEEQLKSEYQGWEQNDTTTYPYVKWGDRGAEYDLFTGFEGLHPTYFSQFIHTFDSVGTIATVTADWPFTHVFIKDECKHYMAYNPPNEPERQITFSDGRSFSLPADTLIVWYPLGEPLTEISTDTNTFCPGEIVQISVSDSTDGGETPIFDWFINGDSIPGIHQSEVHIDSLSDGDTVFVVMYTSLKCYSYESDTSNWLIFEQSELFDLSILLSASDSIWCPGDTINLSTSTENGGDSIVYTWYQNFVQVDNDSANWTVDSLSDSTYFHVGLWSNARCLVDSLAYSDTILIRSYPSYDSELNITTSMDSLCLGDSLFASVQLDSVPIGAITWYINDQISDSDSSSIAIQTKSDSTLICAIWTSSGPICGDSIVFSDTSLTRVFSSQTPKIELFKNSQFYCEGDSVVLWVDTLNTSEGSTIQWFVNEEIASTNDTLFVIQSLITNDTLLVQLTSKSACSVDSIFLSNQLIVNPTEPISIETNLTASSDSICRPGEVVFNIEYTPIDISPTINWYYNGSLINQNIESISQMISHSDDLVSFELITDETCVDTNTVLDTIRIVSAPPITWDLTHFIELEYGSSYELDLASNANSWTWSTPEGLSNPHIETPILTATIREWKYVSMTNNICSAKDSIEIWITQELLIPNTFTPNGDGIHDTWHLTGIENYPNVVIKIYNRWGNIVYENAGYPKDWDGTAQNGKPLPVATYYYIISVNSDQLNQETKNRYEGHVSIIR